MRVSHQTLADPSQRRPANGFLFFIFLVILVWAPLPLASNRVWSASLLAGLLVMLLLLVAISDFVRGASHLGRVRVAAWPIGGLIGIFALMGTQLIDFSGNGPFSADPHHSLLYAMLTAGYLAAFMLVLLLVTTTERAGFLAGCLIFSGLLQALLGIFLYWAGAKYTIFFTDIQHTHVMGSFVYRNSLANYLLICLGLGIGLVISRMQADTPGAQGGRHGWLGTLAHFSLSPAMALRIVLIVLVIALVLTRSRGGNASFMIALGVLTLGFLVYSKNMRLKKIILLLMGSILIIDLAVIGKFIGAERVMERLNQTPIMTVAPGGETPAEQSPGKAQPIKPTGGFHEESLQDRSGPALAALGMALERPLLGFGAGTFYSVFPRFAQPEHTGYYDHAHNDYAQIAAELGLIGLGLFAIVLASSIRQAVRVLKHPLRSADYGLALGALIAMVAVFSQAFVDFHFQIPANTFTFIVVLALVWVLRHRSQQSRIKD